MFKTILFPVDQSREAREAADVALNLVKMYQANLVILAVVEPEPEPGQEPHSETMTSPENVAELLAEAQGMFQDAGVEVKTMERQGKPAFTICDVADEIEADLIIIGSRGTGLTEQGPADSVTNRIINLSPCPVLVVP
ncbi:MAG: universal stress protein [Oscillatoriales cyanobacterium RM2_1_1]|nr:universal stress protein [Oscillatoriales cyanobacterium SM2_3_0]NJO47189.1 universal stress protein [Oscillatoriales cyanobacterium RM2_1_1]